MSTQIGGKGETPVTLTFAALASLASNALGVSNAIDFTSLTPDAIDVQVEIVIDPGTTSGNKKAGAYLITSVDGTNFSDPLNRGNMLWLGDISLPDTNIVRSQALSCLKAMNGAPLPAAGKIVVWNDSGVAFNSTGNSAQYREVRGDTS
ncbi:MAG: hypothetical protein ABI605_10920 [Rhizobacter sp.]